MDCREGNIQKERLALVPFDELDRLATEGRRMVGRRFGRLPPTMHDDFLAVLFRRTDAVLKDSIEFIEAAGERVLALLFSQVPLANDARFVTRSLQPLGDRHLREVESKSLTRVRVVPRPVLVPA